MSKNKYIILVVEKINNVDTLVERKVLSKIVNPIPLKRGKIVVDYAKPTYVSGYKFVYVVSSTSRVDATKISAEEMQRLFDMRLIERVVHASREKLPMTYIIFYVICGLLGFFIGMSIFKTTTGGSEIIVP